jgi:cardiolipin synthase A/B
MSRRKKSSPYTVHNIVKIIRGGRDYFECIEEIADNARSCIHLQTYIFDEDETGRKVAAALIRAAQRNVSVYVLVDGYASQNLSSSFTISLKEAGIHFSFFEPLFKSSTFYIGRRLHHKLVVADSSVCLVAGINISNRYNDIGNTKAWLDWAIQVQGDVARIIEDVCVRRWNGSPLRKRCAATPRAFRHPLPAENCLVRVRRNDWVYRRTEITRSYREMLWTARREIIIMTSYFSPPRKLLRGMAAATKRGVSVRLILTANADVPFSKYAERYLYPWLFRNKIQVFEYRTNILHGKIATYDNKWITSGSYNVNNISAFASVELNLDMLDDRIASEVQDRLQDIIANDCIEIIPSDFLVKINFINKFFYYVSYRFVHMIFFLFTFYFVQKREKE